MKIEPNNLYLGDCLELMKQIDDESVDAIICDLPYGQIACKWDSIIPFEKLWEHYTRIIKKNRAIVLFGAEPFSSKLRLSNLNWYKYDWVWIKTRATDFFNCKLKPMKKFENIMIFSNGSTANGSKNNILYNPQGLISCNREVCGIRDCIADKAGHRYGRPSHKKKRIQEFTNYPNNVLEFASEGKSLHPTQKPLTLLEYLVNTYTNEGDIVLDNCIGSGTTAVACINTNRQWIGIELLDKYYKIAKERIENAKYSD